MLFFSYCRLSRHSRCCCCAVHTHTRTRTHTHTHTRTRTHTHTHTHARTHTHTTHTHTRTRTRTRTHTHTHARHAHARTHARTHAHTACAACPDACASLQMYCPHGSYAVTALPGRVMVKRLGAIVLELQVELSIDLSPQSARLQLQKCKSIWAVSGGGLLTPLTFARHRLSPLAAFTSGAYFLHNGRQWQ